MENENGHCNSETIGNSFYRRFLEQNIFEDKFLKEKDIALRPIIISDFIPEDPKNQNNKKSIIIKPNEEKDIKYGSNIIYVDSKLVDSENEEEESLQKQIKMIISQQKRRNNKSIKKEKNKL